MLIEELIPLNEMIIRHRTAGEGTTVVAHRGSIWVFDTQEVNDKESELYQQIRDSIHSDFDDILQLPDDRPDVFVGELRSDELHMQADAGAYLHPVTAPLVKKVAMALGVSVHTSEFDITASDGVSVERGFWWGDMHAELPYIGYHGTVSVHIDAIVKFGLRSLQNAGNWDIGAFDAVYFSVSESTARFHAIKTSDATNFSFPVIIKFKIPDRNKIVADYDVANVVGMDYQKADSMGYSGTRAFNKPSEAMVSANKGSKLYKSASMFGYEGRVPSKFFLEIIANMGMEESDDWITFDNLADFMVANKIWDDRGYYYEGMEDEDYE